MRADTEDGDDRSWDRVRRVIIVSVALLAAAPAVAQATNVTVTNTAQSPETFFLDPRTSSMTTIPLPDVNGPAAAICDLRCARFL